MDLERIPYPHSRCMKLDGSPSRLALHKPSAMLAVICSRVNCEYAAPEAMCTSTLCAAQDELQCIRATSGGSHSPPRPIRSWTWFEVMCCTCPFVHIVGPAGHVPWFPCLVCSAARLNWQSAISVRPPYRIKGLEPNNILQYVVAVVCKLTSLLHGRRTFLSCPTPLVCPRHLKSDDVLLLSCATLLWSTLPSPGGTDTSCGNLTLDVQHL